jgi:hypothetical protein
VTRPIAPSNRDDRLAFLAQPLDLGRTRESEVMIAVTCAWTPSSTKALSTSQKQTSGT